MSAAAGLLAGAHAVIAMRRGPHWLLSDQDSKAYGRALANALRHLPIQMAQKWIDFSALGLAIFAYETPRFSMDIQLRRQAEQQRQQRPQPMGQVFQFRPPQAAPSAAPQPPQQPQPSPVPGAATAMASTDMTYEPELGEPA